MLGNRHAQHSFAQIPEVNIPRSSFDRSFTMKDTFDFDYLTPIYVDEVIPGDTHNLTVNSFIRLATQIVPIMDNLYVDFFFFFVPNRLVFDNWEKMCGAQDNPGDSTSFIFPIMTPGAAFTAGSIFDKFGLPIAVANIAIKNSLPLRCYSLIWNDWFRDQNLQNSLTVPTDDGPDVQGDFALQKRGRRHDYFTSALPWPQKGPAVTLPLGGTAPVGNLAPDATNSNALGIYGTTDFATYGVFPLGSALPGHPTYTGGQYPAYAGSSNNTVYANMTGTVSDAGAVLRAANAGNPSIGIGVPFGGLTADLSSATAATINQLRLAIMTQSLLELDARGGTRYVEILKAHYKVVSPDFRLQRPEYLGGGEIRINSHVVANTTNTQQANLAAFATGQSGGQSIGFTKSFVEHGYVIGLACARADITYQQGINRLWMKSTRYDLFWPKLQELGEQAINLGEIYAAGTSADYNTVFGYQERYAEHRYKPSEIHGELRSTFTTPLDMWHMADDYGSAPALNSTFIQQNTPITRAIAVSPDNFGSNELIADYFFKLTSARPMTVSGVPATLGRF